MRKRGKPKLNPHEEFSELFTGLGEVTFDYKIELTDSAKPYALTMHSALTYSNAPIYLAEQELKRVEAKGGISKVEKLINPGVAG